MKAYMDIVNRILNEGIWKDNRTGIRTLTIAGAMFEHDMQQGFPLITTKHIATKTMKVELEGFIKGITDKNWFKERGCKIWNEWCNPEKVPYGHDEETRKKMAEERDLGPIYGFQWRHSGADYKGYEHNYEGEGIDLLETMIDKLKNNPEDRRNLVMAWNPKDLAKMALPPCHYGYQAIILDNKLNLLWNQRSVDTMLGLPFNIASYGTLLHLLAKEANLGEGKLIGFLADVHIYENHLMGVIEQLTREPRDLPDIVTEDFTKVSEWDHTKTKYINYDPHPKINFPLAI